MSWAPELVAELNQRQQDGRFHPYTCGTDDCGESFTCKDWADQDHEVFFRSVLVATTAGWQCPRCDYTQDWYL